MSSERTFTVHSSEFGLTGGNYKSSTPRAAATKAARILFKEHKKSTKVVKFILRETTRGSAKKEYFYQATLQRFDTPLVIVRNGVSINVTKKITIKSLDEKEMGHLTHTMGRHNLLDGVEL